MQDFNLDQNGDLMIINSTPCVQVDIDHTKMELYNIIVKNIVFFNKQYIEEHFLTLSTSYDSATNSLNIKKRLLKYFQTKYYNEQCINYLDITILKTDIIKIFFKCTKDKTIFFYMEVKI